MTKQILLPSLLLMTSLAFAQLSDTRSELSWAWRLSLKIKALV
ncbi:hypothetical protein [Pseudoalteromonas sp. S16_S37]|nr:hypothetical protein [Pseudoalteromonas sp. S16_S37]